MSSEYDENPRRASFLEGAIDPTPVTCALCGSKETSELVKNKEARAVICTTCSLAFLSPRLTKDGYDRFYREYFQEGRRELATLDDAVKRLEKKGAYANKTPYVKAFAPHIKKDGRYVEIGAGWGTLAKRLQDETGAIVEVVEPSQLASEVAEKHYKLTAHKGSGEEFMKSTDTKYDGVILVHVFEHLLDPNEFLASVRRILKPDGVLLFALPNLTSPDEPVEKYFHIEHTYYYTPTTLSMMLKKHGFKLVELTPDTHEMRAVFKMLETTSPLPKYDNDERGQIGRRLEALKARYGLLRGIKEVLLRLVPRGFHEPLKALGARVARKLGIVKH